MKKLLFFLVITIASHQTNAQYRKIKKTTKTIVQQRSIYLNGGVKASLNGKSRVCIPFDLPANTKEWYYSFSTAPGQSGVKLLNLGIQLSALLLDKTGKVSSITNQVKVPEGSNSVDVYLLTAQNQKAFIEKWDNHGGAFYYITEGTTNNTKQAVVRVDDVKSGRFFLGLKNPSTLNGVNIFIEVIAIVEQEVYVDEWITKNKNQLKADCLKRFYTQSTGKSDVCDCLVSKITNQNKPSEWLNQSLEVQESLKKSKLNNCFIETDNMVLKEEELAYREKLRIEKETYDRNVKEVQQVLKEAYAASELSNYKEAREKTILAIDLVTRNKNISSAYNSAWIASRYSSAAWHSILLNEVDVAGEYLKKSLSNNPQDMYMRGNLGFFHLLKGNYPEAQKAFLYYKRRKRLPDKRKWVDVVADGLDILEQKGMGNTNFDKIRNLLKIKTKK